LPASLRVNFCDKFAKLNLCEFGCLERYGGQFMFKKEFGDWTKYRELEPLEIDYHHDGGELDGLSYYERMDRARKGSLAIIKRAQKDGIPWVLFTHGHSTSRIGATC
jgi:hypothetical protein